jgi:hypothetical protein
MIHMRESAYKNRQVPGQFKEYVNKIDESIKDVFSSRIWMPAFFFLLLWFVFQWPPSSVRSLEGRWYDSAFWFAVIMLDWVIALCWMQFMRIWANLQSFLQALERHPIRTAFSRLEKEVDWVPLVTQVKEHPLLITSRCMDCLHALSSLQGTLSCPIVANVSEKLSAAGGLDDLFGDIEKSLLSGSSDEYRTKYDDLQKGLDELHEAIEKYFHASEWKRGDSESLNHELAQAGVEKKRLPPADQVRILGEEFVALRHMMYMRYAFRHLRNLLGFVITGFILAVITVNVYPFQGERWLAFTAVVAFLVLGLGVGMVFAQMDRDKIMSRITATPPGKLGGTFFLRIAEFGGLPLLTVLAAQFPALNRILTSFLQPAMEALR